MIKRWLEEELMNKLAYRRGVHLTGARQVSEGAQGRFWHSCA